MARPNQKPGRPFKVGETVEHRVVVTCTPTEYRTLESKRGDVPRSTYIKKLILADASEIDADTTDVPLIGVCCAGEGTHIGEASPSGFVRLPIAVPHGAVAVLVDGESMISLNERISVPSGSYAIFRPEEMPVPGIPVLALVRDERDDWKAMLKVFGGTSGGKVTLEPRNARHRTLVLDADNVRIKGVYYTHWPKVDIAQQKQELDDAHAKNRQRLGMANPDEKHKREAA